jgi:NADPH:quinone reductase-like Zn-dependent oxidoreductase
MKAVQLIAHGAPGKFELRDVPDPVPNNGEVLVEVRACGLNHLDLWLEEAALPIPIQLPRTPGCEIAGTVLATGGNPGAPASPPVTNLGAPASLPAPLNAWKPGEHVAVQSNIFCGECEFCRVGEESMCLNNIMLGVHRDGGFAERVVVPERALVRLPDKVTFETSAALSLAGSTAMHMLTDRAEVKAGDWVLVIGAASGVGSAAIQIARTLGARVITTGSTEAKRQFGRELGAEFALDPSDPKWQSEVRKITDKRGVDVVVEHVGGVVLQQCFQCLARGGTIVTCGATAGRETNFDLWPFFVKQQRLVGSYGRNRKDLELTLEWAAEGKLTARIDEILPLDRVPEAFARLRNREVRGKLVISPCPAARTE